MNASTIKLYVEHPPLSQAMYYCYDKTQGSAVCLNSVIVGTKPKPVTDFSCISHNFENLTCTWTAPQNYIRTNYSLKYHFQGRNSRGYFNCPDITQDTQKDGSDQMKCFWDITTEPHYRQSQPIYFMQLTAANEFGNFTLLYNFTHYANVIPAPPTGLSILNKTTESLLLEWVTPQPMWNFPPGLVHRVLYQCEFDNKSTWVMANTSQLSNREHSYRFNLTGLPYAHALYDIRVSSRSVKASETDEHMWSRNASSTSRTLSKLPATPPLTNIGSFEIINGLNYRDIIIYWQYIPDHMKNGENVTYQIIAVEEDSVPVQGKTLIPIEITSTYAKFNNLSLSSYRFTVATVNELGLSKNVSYVYVPAHEARVPEPTGFAKISFSQYTYELSWNAPTVQDSNDPIENYTIFWCNNDVDRPFQCKGYLKWIELPNNFTSYNITVPKSGIYQFAISANTKRASSGMVWASCTVLLYNGIGKMKNLWIDNVGSTFIHITWQLGCSDQIAGIEGFRIFYCPIVSPVELFCKEPETEMIIEDPSATQGNITGLRPYTTYRLTVSVITRHSSNSLQSDYRYNTTLEGVPDTPLNVSVHNVTNSTVTVVWSAPLRMNGVLQYYEVLYTSSRNERYKKNLESSGISAAEIEQKIVLDKLRSYTEYTITVAACTKSCSAASLPVKVRTAVSSKYKIVYIVIY